MSLSDKVSDYIGQQPAGFPILASDIVEEMLPVNHTEEDIKKTRQNVYVIVARLLQKEEGFCRYTTGVYYRTDSHCKNISMDILIQRLFIKDLDGEVFGYITGESLAYQLGYIKEQPHKLQIATNSWRKQIDEDQLGVEVSAPAVPVSSENAELLQLLDLLKWHPEITNKESNCRKLVTYALQNDVDTIELMSLAVQHYSQKVTLTVAKLTPYYLKAKQRYSLQGMVTENS